MPRGKRVRTHNDLPSETIQSDAPKADLRLLLQRYTDTGILEHLDQVELQYRDVSEFTDLQDALNQTREAEAQFNALPARVRRLFRNDVAVWLDTGDWSREIS